MLELITCAIKVLTVIKSLSMTLLYLFSILSMNIKILGIELTKESINYFLSIRTKIFKNTRRLYDTIVISHSFFHFPISKLIKLIIIKPNIFDSITSVVACLYCAKS